MNIGRPRTGTSTEGGTSSGLPKGKIIGGVAAATAVGVTTFGLLAGGWHGRAVIDPPTCGIADATNCTNEAGRTVIINATEAGDWDGAAAFWECDTALLSETHADATSVTGTGYPVKIVIGFPDGETVDGTAAAIDPGCVGDTDADGPDNIEGNLDDCENTIDLVIEVEGNGIDTGPLADAFKQRTTLNPTCGLQITGTLNCGPGPLLPGGNGTSHSDTIQAQGGNNIWYYDVTTGDWDAGEATCQGAGGTFFYSSAASNKATNTHVIRAKMVGCNATLNDGDFATGNSGSVPDSQFRGGRTESVATGGHEACVGYAASGCSLDNSLVTETNVDCEIWDDATNTWVEE